MDILSEIFKGRELTVTPFQREIEPGKHTPPLYHKSAICTLNKWSRIEKSVDIPVEIFKYLVEREVLVLDSGNFETGEEHYIYNMNRKKDLSNGDKLFEYLKPILREIRLNKLIK